MKCEYVGGEACCKFTDLKSCQICVHLSFYGRVCEFARES